MDFGEAFEDGAGGVVGGGGALVDGDLAGVGDEVEVGEGAAGVDAEDGHGGSVQGWGTGGSKGVSCRSRMESIGFDGFRGNWYRQERRCPRSIRRVAKAGE